MRKSKKKRLKSHGFLTPDVRTNRHLIDVARTAGWKIRTVSEGHTQMSDELLAKTYGKGQSVFLTYDKEAYKSNPKHDGFVGFIEYDLISKDVLEEFCTNFTKVLSSISSSTISGYRIIINDNGSDFQKISLGTGKKQKSKK